MDIGWIWASEKIYTKRIERGFLGVGGEANQLIYLYGLNAAYKNGNDNMTINTSTVIDLVFSNINNFDNVGSLNCNLSDHIPTFIINKWTKSVKEYESVFKRSMKH